MSVEVELSQNQFLQAGGVLQRALLEKFKTGEMAPPSDYEYQEYPKVLRLNPRIEVVEHVTEDIKGKTLRTTSEKRVFDEILVHSEEEEERVMAGGKPSAEIEQDRQDLVQRCRNVGIRADASWSVMRLRRELGEKMDAPEPADELSKMKAKLAELEEMAAVQARMAALQAQLAQPVDDTEYLRSQLVALGVAPDKRWGAARLREELDRATAPDAA